MPNPTINTFELLTANEPVSKSLKQILNFIRGLLSEGADFEQIIFKAKIIITELLTNAIKHAGSSETVLRVTVNYNTDITIEKIDFGNRFNPCDTYFKATGKNIIRLSKDSMHSIYCVGDENTSIKFVCEDCGGDNTPDINSIKEHFGLLIITKAADVFTYHYDEISGSNTFTVVLRLR